MAKIYRVIQIKLNHFANFDLPTKRVRALSQ